MFISVFVGCLSNVLTVGVAIDKSENPVGIGAAAEDRCWASAAVDVKFWALGEVGNSVNFYLDSLVIHTIKHELLSVSALNRPDRNETCIIGGRILESVFIYARLREGVLKSIGCYKLSIEIGCLNLLRKELWR